MHVWALMLSADGVVSAFPDEPLHVFSPHCCPHIVMAKLKGENPDREHQVKAILSFLTEPWKSESIASAMVTSLLRFKRRKQTLPMDREMSVLFCKTSFGMRFILVPLSLKNTSSSLSNNDSELASAPFKPLISLEVWGSPHFQEV